MFEPKQFVIYQSCYKNRELPAKEQVAIFGYMKPDDQCVIYVKEHGEFKKRKEVNKKYLRAK